MTMQKGNIHKNLRIQIDNFSMLLKYTDAKLRKNLLIGIKAIANPQTISRLPITLLYHLAGILKSNISVRGNTLAYLTYSFLCNKRKNFTLLKKLDKK